MKPTASTRRRPATMPNSRWLAYASAGAASTLCCAVSSEADIIYSGLINYHFDEATGLRSYRFPLNQPGNSILLSHNRSGIHGSAFFSLFTPIVAGAVAGFSAGSRSTFRRYVSKLAFGQSINTRPFVDSNGILAIGYGFEGGAPYNAQWLDPGTGFVGFRFNGGSGLQYGWARIDMDGQPGNSFTLIDYAFADPGERITAGQTGTATVPESGGSLGLLALGCTSLLAWRAARASKRQLRVDG